MINYNGTLLETLPNFETSTRAFLYGDAVFETIKVSKNKVLFLEDHYFRLMASMRILRMQIPIDFTLENIENEILKTTKSRDNARVRMTVFRNSGGKYLPKTRATSYLIEAESLESFDYKFVKDSYEVDLFKDFLIAKGLLSTLKTTNRMVNIVGSIYAEENDLHNCILMNSDKNIIEFLNGNIFMFFGNVLVTPAISDGCLNGIMRKQILKIAHKLKLEIQERSISPFELQTADEMFMTNVIVGIKPVSKYRKKEFSSEITKQIFDVLNRDLV